MLGSSGRGSSPTRRHELNLLAGGRPKGPAVSGCQERHLRACGHPAEAQTEGWVCSPCPAHCQPRPCHAPTPPTAPPSAPRPSEPREAGAAAPPADRYLSWPASCCCSAARSRPAAASLTPSSFPELTPPSTWLPASSRSWLQRSTELSRPAATPGAQQGGLGGHQPSRGLTGPPQGCRPSLHVQNSQVSPPARMRLSLSLSREATTSQSQGNLPRVSAADCGGPGTSRRKQLTPPRRRGSPLRGPHAGLGAPWLFPGATVQLSCS